MGEKVNLSGCASEWDDVKDLRTSLRRTGSIFSPLPGKLAVEPSVDAASLNFPALLPVVRRLHDGEDGHVGMVAIGHVEAQLLASLFAQFTLHVQARFAHIMPNKSRNLFGASPIIRVS